MKMEVDTSDHSKLNVWLYALLSTTMIGLAPIAIIYFIPFNIGPQAGRKSQYTLRVLLAFAVGGLLGDVFLHLLPHAAHADEHHHDHDSLQDEHHHSHGSSGFWVLVGIMTFLIIEKTILCIGGSDHGHSHAKKEEKIEASSDKDSEQLPQSSLRRRNKQPKDNHASADQSPQHKIEEPKPSHSLAVSAYLNLAADFTHNFTDGM
jgi:solute carrier family 39 (zinc transporter), member 7